MQSTCRRTSAWRRTMTVAPVALVLSLAVLHPDCADEALEREHLAALVRQIELADRLANQVGRPDRALRRAARCGAGSGGQQRRRLPEPFADAHAARPDPLRRQEPFLRRTARRRAQVVHAEEPGLHAVGVRLRQRLREHARRQRWVWWGRQQLRRQQGHLRQPANAAAEGRALARSALGHAGVPQQVRRGHGAGPRRHRRRCAGAGQVRSPRREVAGAKWLALSVAKPTPV